VDIKALGARIARLRDEIGLSQDSLALKSKVARNLISSLEKGKGNPTLGTLEALAKELGVSVLDLLGESKPSKPPRSPRPAVKAPPDVDDVFALLSRYRDLSPERKAVVAMFVFDDPAYLAAHPDFSHAVEAFLRSSKLPK
jgi:transcriptional regulator with XRE-family HTH domain